MLSIKIKTAISNAWAKMTKADVVFISSMTEDNYTVAISRVHYNPVTGKEKRKCAGKYIANKNGDVVKAAYVLKDDGTVEINGLGYNANYNNIRWMFADKCKQTEYILKKND